MTEVRKPPPGERVLRIDELTSKVGLRRTSIYDLMALGRFPRPVRLTTQRRGWLLSEVDTWLEARKAERDEQKPLAKP